MTIERSRYLISGASLMSRICSRVTRMRKYAPAHAALHDGDCRIAADERRRLYYAIFPASRAAAELRSIAPLLTVIGAADDRCHSAIRLSTRDDALRRISREDFSHAPRSISRDFGCRADGV